MTLPSGVTSESQTYDDLVAGEVKIKALTVDSAATVAKGQVYEYDPTAHNFINLVTAGVLKPPYAVCTETRTIAADVPVSCIISGDVHRAKLDATSLTNLDVDAALQSSGINAVPGGVV